MKNFLNRFIKNKKNKITLFLYILFAIWVLFSNTSDLWLIVVTIFLVVSIFLDFKFRILFLKSFLIQLGITFVIVAGLIIYASLQYTGKDDITFNSAEEIQSSPFYNLCLSLAIDKENNFLISLGYTQKDDGSWINKDGNYPGEDFDESNEEALMTEILFNCMENKGSTIDNFDDVKRYKNLISTGDYNCSDFNTWEDAQKVFIRDNGLKEDPYKLDQNKNGIVCESLIKK